ncbi:MAG: hypothetical protein WCY05_07755 [Candidatus Omnitrophota bacterium]
MALFDLFPGSSFPKNEGFCLSSNNAGNIIRKPSQFNQFSNRALDYERKVLQKAHLIYDALDQIDKDVFNYWANNGFYFKWPKIIGQKNGFNVWLSCYSSLLLSDFYYNGPSTIDYNGVTYSFPYQNYTFSRTSNLNNVGLFVRPIQFGGAFCPYSITSASVSIVNKTVSFTIHISGLDPSPTWLFPFHFFTGYSQILAGIFIYTSVNQSSTGSRFTPLNRLLIGILQPSNPEYYDYSLTTQRDFTITVPWCKFADESTFKFVSGVPVNLTFFSVSSNCSPFPAGEISAMVT